MARKQVINRHCKPQCDDNGACRTDDRKISQIGRISNISKWNHSYERIPRESTQEGMLDTQFNSILSRPITISLPTLVDSPDNLLRRIVVNAEDLVAGHVVGELA